MKQLIMSNLWVRMFAVAFVATLIVTGVVAPSTAPPAAAATNCAASVLKQGSKGPCVVDLQKRLNAAGSNVGTADGSFGPKTRAGVIDYQRKNKLTVDGIAGPQTWRSLTNTPPKPTAAKPAATPSSALQVGSKGDRVRDLQNRLARASFAVGRAGADGSFGGDTKAAVIRFQQHYKLPATGVVDTKTWSTLVNNPGAPASRLSHLSSIKNNAGVNIVADKSDRTAYVFENGKLQRAITVRFGGEGVYKGVPFAKSTPNGTFWVQAKIRHGYSQMYEAKMPFFTVFNGHIGFHQSADFASTGYGANGKRGSNGCVNIGNSFDAQFVFDRSKTGYTRVAVQN